jgi:hypothetical protein
VGVCDDDGVSEIVGVCEGVGVAEVEGTTVPWGAGTSQQNVLLVSK